MSTADTVDRINSKLREFGYGGISLDKLIIHRMDEKRRDLLFAGPYEQILYLLNEAQMDEDDILNWFEL